MKQILKSGLLFCVMLAIMEKGWAQTAHKKSTANAQVRVLDTAFYMPQLKRHRRIWLYLPKNYHTSRERYPVLYLQDGQNMFDAATSFSGEWGVDEAMDSLTAQGGGCIVVAIDNGGEKRLSEYSPFDFSMGEGEKKMDIKGEGAAYVDFLVHTLRPYLRKNFRVSRKSRHHFIAGSSMGGLIALYAVLHQPKAWGGAGVFSPAFWVVKDQLVGALQKDGSAIHCPIYLYAGQDESKDMVPDMLLVHEVLDKVSRAKTTVVIRAGARHSEGAWQSEFPQFYHWLKQQWASWK